MKSHSRHWLTVASLTWLTLILVAAAPHAHAQTASRTFPSTAIGNTSAAQTLTLSNTSIISIPITSISVSGDFAQTNNCGKSLGRLSSCTITVTFSPTAVGTRTGVVTVKTPVGNSTANLSGTGIAPVSLSATSLAFGSQTVGLATAAQSVTVKNAMSTTLTMKSVTVSGDYTQTNNCGSSLAAGASCSVSVIFKPTAAGSRTGTLTISDSAVGGTQTVSLGGTGVAVAVKSIALTPANPSVVKGKTQQIAATATYSNNTTADVTATATWSSNKTTVATVSKGMTTAVATGAATISAALSGITGSTTVTVPSATLVSIAVTPATASIPKGKTQQYAAVGTYSDGTTQVLTTTAAWTTTTGATITTGGLATGSAVATSTVTATSGTIKGTASLAVTAPALVSIAVSPATASIAKGTTQQYSAVGTYTDATTQTITTSVAWTATANASIASSGLATGAAAGSSTITATSGTIKGTAALTVQAATLVSIAVSPATASIPKGKTQQYAAVGTYSDGTTQSMTSVTWSATTGATITASGMATASAVGTPTITATSGTINGTASLTVAPAALVSVAVTPANASIAKGLTQQFTATGTYTDNTTQNLTSSVVWSATPQATISAGGLATGAMQGAATISAASGTISGTVALNVLAPALTVITVSPAGAAIPKGTTQQYNAMGTYTDATTQDVTASVTWSATAGASITAAGMATGTAQGTPVISATSGAIAGSASLTVLPPALTGITVTPASASIAAGTTQQYAAQGSYTDGSTQNLTGSVIWTASGASINASGLASTSVQGAATVSAASGSISGSASLTVLAPALTAISISPADASVVKGSTQQFSAQGTYTDGSSQDVTGVVSWSASSGATITSGGLATGTIVGSPIITATSGSITNSVALSVMPPAIVSIAITPASVSTGLHGQQQFSAMATYADNSTGDVTNSVTWNSGNSSVVSISSSGFAQAIATASTAIPITATAGGVTSNWAWYSADSSIAMVCPNPTIDLKLLVVTNGGTEADFPAIKQILDYVGTPYTVYDMSQSSGITADMLSDGDCHAYYQGVIFANGGYIYSLAGMPDLTAYEKLFGIRQVNWFVWPGTDFGFDGNNSVAGSNSPVTANFTAAASQVFSYANTNTPLTISNATTYLTAPGSAAAGTTITPLLMDGSGHALSLIYDFGDGRQYLTQTFDSNQYLTHDLILAYGLVNWVTKGVFLGEYHVYASASVDDFFISDAEWKPGTPCTDPITHDRTLADASFLTNFRLKAADMTALVAWQNSKQSDPLVKGFKLSLAFNGVGTTGNNDWTGLPLAGIANDDLVTSFPGYESNFHWLSHTYDHPETLDGLTKSGPADVNGDTIDLEVLTNLWVAGADGGVNLDTDDSDSAMQQLHFTDFNPHSMITPGVTGLDDPNSSLYLSQDGIQYVVSDTSVTPTATNNNGPNPSPNVGIVNSYAPGIYEVPRHANDVYFNAANWDDDAAEFNCLYTSPSPFAGYNGQQILDYVSTSFVNNMLLGDMDPQMFHQPNLHAYDGVHSMIGDTYDMTFQKYEAVYNLPILSPTQDQTAELMKARNNYNLSGVTASWVGGTTPSISITVPADASVPAAVIPVTGWNSTGAEAYGSTNIAHVTVTAGQTVTVQQQ